MPQDTSQLDPSVVALMHGLKMQEGGGTINYNATGDNGTAAGAGQWSNQPNGKPVALSKGEIPSNFINDAKQYGLNPSDFSSDNQNKVMYAVLADDKKKGLTPEQALSKWNSGDPNKYQSQNATGVGSVGRYDVASYVKNGMKYAQDYATKNKTTSQQTQTTSQPQQGFLSSLAHGLIEPVATTLARPIQAGAELLGASSDQVNQATKNIAGNYVAPVPQNFGDVTKDVGRAAQTVALGMPVDSLAGAVGAGAVSGAGSGLEQTGNLQGAATSGALGAGLGLGGGVLSKLLENIPSRLAQEAFKDMTPEEVQKALQEKTIGSTSNLLNQSKKAISNYGSQIDNILKNTTEKGAGDFSIRATTNQFPEYANNVNKMIQKIKNLVPSGTDVGLKGEGWDRATILSYIDKIKDNTATLWEKNRVRSVIDGATSGGYAKLARAINPSAGQDLAMTFANNLRTEVQNSEKSTIPIFQEFSKEMGIKNAIQKVANKKGTGLIRWSDIVPFLAGSSIGGLPGGLATAAVSRFAQSPSAEFGTAKAIQGLGGLARPIISRAGLLPSLLKK